MTSETRSTVYTDGSCPGNPGPVGGLGIYIPSLGQALSWRIEDEDMTNNRAELLAAILALIVDDASSIDIHTDSEYVSKNSVENLERWHKNNYMGVANQDLWKVMYALIYESNRFVYMTHASWFLYWKCNFGCTHLQGASCGTRNLRLGLSSRPKPLVRKKF